jgi:hypothetical protein
MDTPQPRYPDSLPATWLAARLGVDPVRIDAMRRAGELFAVRGPGSQEWLYPAWQFEDWRPRRAIARIVAVAQERGLDDARVYELMTAPRGLLGGTRRRLVDLLAEGREEDVLAALRAG